MTWPLRSYSVAGQIRMTNISRGFRNSFVMRHSSFSANPVIFRSTSPEGNDQGKLGDSRNSAAVSESEVKCSHVRDVFYSQDSVCTRLRSVPSARRSSRIRQRRYQSGLVSKLRPAL